MHNYSPFDIVFPCNYLFLHIKKIVIDYSFCIFYIKKNLICVLFEFVLFIIYLILHFYYLIINFFFLLFKFYNFMI